MGVPGGIQATCGMCARGSLSRGRSRGSIPCACVLSPNLSPRSESNLCVSAVSFRGAPLPFPALLLLHVPDIKRSTCPSFHSRSPQPRCPSPPPPQPFRGSRVLFQMERPPFSFTSGRRGKLCGSREHRFATRGRKRSRHHHRPSTPALPFATRR